MEEYYQSQIKTIDGQLRKESQAAIYYNVSRIVLFMSILAAICWLVAHPAWISVGYVGLTILLFVFILIKSDKYDSKTSYYQTLKKVYEQELAGIQHNRFFYDNGANFTDAAHPYTGDLDIFGEQLLFHSINRCHTLDGCACLAKQLSNPPQDIHTIRERQEAIKELQQDKKDFIFHLLALLSMRKRKSTRETITLWLSLPNKFSISKTMKLMMYVLPFINLFLLGSAFVYPNGMVVLLAFIVLQGILFKRYRKSVQLLKQHLNAIIGDVSNFRIYADAIKRETFQSSGLQQLQRQVIRYNKSTGQLYNLLDVFDRSDTFIGYFGNIIFLNSIKTAIKLEKWKTENKENLPQLIESICEWETLISLAVFAMNHPRFVFPEIEDPSSSVMMEAKDMGHPLIPEDKNVTNEMTIHKSHIFIITGANMAGKSTFLRTIGVNLLLAQTGAPVCASSFRCIPTSLFTSMRTIDNLGNGISYFYAEALRIKQLLSCISSGKTFLLLMDELFRGTNSDDRLTSSLSFIRKLTRYSNLSAFIATHDLGITLLESEYPDKVKNYCFECEHTGEQITFDYKLKRGIAKSHNAYRLLQQMQVVD